MIKWKRIEARANTIYNQMVGRHWALKGRDSDMYFSALRIHATSGLVTQSTTVPTLETGENYLKIEATNTTPGNSA